MVAYSTCQSSKVPAARKTRLTGFRARTAAEMDRANDSAGAGAKLGRYPQLNGTTNDAFAEALDMMTRLFLIYAVGTIIEVTTEISCPEELAAIRPAAALKGLIVSAVKQGRRWILKFPTDKATEALADATEAQVKAIIKEAQRQVPIGKLLQGKGQLAGPRRNPNLHGVDVEALLKKSLAELEKMAKNGDLSERTVKQFKKLFELRDLRHGQ
jgi:hypothetical protein